MSQMDDRRLREDTHSHTGTLHSGYLLIIFSTLLIIGSFFHLDRLIQQLSHHHQDSLMLTGVALLGTELGGRSGVLLTPVLIALARERWKRFAVTLLAALATQQAAIELLKFLTGRPRPWQTDNAYAFFGPGQHDMHSFPSGHTSFVVTVAVVAAAYFPRRRWIAYGVAILVAVGRICGEVHFLSDCLTGALIGTIAAVSFLRRWPPEPAAETPDE